MIVNFKEYNKRARDFFGYKDKLLLVIDDFIIYDEDFKKNHDIDYYKESYEFYMQKSTGGWVCHVKYYNKYKHEREVTFTVEENDRLEKFMENPDLYKNTKNFNI